MQRTLLKNAFFFKIYLYKVCVHVQWTPPLLLHPPPLPALKWQMWKFSYRKNVEFNCSYMYISEAQNMAL